MYWQMVKAQKMVTVECSAPNVISILNLFTPRLREHHTGGAKKIVRARDRGGHLWNSFFWAQKVLKFRSSLKLWLPVWACTTFIKSYQILWVWEELLSCHPCWVLLAVQEYWGCWTHFYLEVCPLKISQILVDCSVSTCRNQSSFFCVKYAVFHLHVSQGLCVCAHMCPLLEESPLVGSWPPS